ncbi:MULTISPECIES: PHP-associated domain-containing protein [unclassified Pseudomonas]|uniref:PHP-associated domain-containing protein n=1 Tax=unclassified Pseudomonas TaxID=196821 RepID=UPI0035BF00C2
MNRTTLDAHVHLLMWKQQAAPDWHAVSQALNVARLNELDAICITEHIEADAYEKLMLGLFSTNRLDGNPQRDGSIVIDGVTVLPGAELQLTNNMNIGVHSELEILLSLDRRVGKYTLETLYEHLEKQGRAFKLVAHHIFWPGKTCSNLDTLKRYVNAIEVPAKDLTNAHRYLKLASQLQLDTTGGSDAHSFISVGTCKTVLEENSPHPQFTLEKWLHSRNTTHEPDRDSLRLTSLAQMHRRMDRARRKP